MGRPVVRRIHLIRFSIFESTIYLIIYELQSTKVKSTTLRNLSYCTDELARRSDVRVGLWYEVTADQGEIAIELIKERVSRAEPVVMAFDIETTKAPLKFPDQQQDQVMMISYMIDGQVCYFLALVISSLADASSPPRDRDS